MKTAAELDERWERNFNAAQHRLLLKERAVAFLGGKCRLCKYDRCAAALEFHHRDPSEKDFVISSKMSWSAIESELPKTVLVCATCHREIHAGLHPAYLDGDDSAYVGRDEDFSDGSTLGTYGVDVAAGQDAVDSEVRVEASNDLGV